MQNPDPKQEQEVMYFILVKSLNINYENLISYYEKVIKFAIKTSDVFSIIAYQKKPYSVIPPFTDNDEFLEKLEPHLVNKKAGIRNWPGSATNNNHRVLCVYNCCNLSRNELLQLPNFFLAIENNMPEDICFYRKGVAWLVTVSHEEYAFMYNSTEEDIAFLEENNISYSISFETVNYLLPT